MEGLKASLREQLRNFWRGHIEGWRQSDLNQREYCELHGLPLKRFGNWRAELRHEDPVPERKVRWRRGLPPGHMVSHMANAPAVPAMEELVPAVGSQNFVRRNNFPGCEIRPRQSLYAYGNVSRHSNGQFGGWSFEDRQSVNYPGFSRFSYLTAKGSAVPPQDVA